MKSLNIALYFFSDMDRILDSILNHDRAVRIKPFFIDPYPARSNHWEATVAHYANNFDGFTRTHWSYMETSNFTSFKSHDDLSRIFPYAKRTELEDFINSSKENVERLPVNFYESIFMAQRSLAGLRSHIELISYIRQVHQFWVDYLTYCKIDALISSNVPHAFTDFLLTEACRTLKIPCICSDIVNLSKGAYYIDLTSGNHIKNPINRRSDSIELIELASVINNCSPERHDHKKIYSQELNDAIDESKRQMNKFLMSTKHEAGFIINEKIKLAKEYDDLAISKPIPKDYRKCNYLFLHYQPEASSIPLAGRYADQMIAVEHIKSNMDDDECLIIKEHPRQFFEYGNVESNIDHIKNILRFRTTDFYRTAAKFERVYFCPRNKSVRAILKEQKTVIWSPTGSINLQAFLSGCDFNCLDTYTPYKYLIPHKASQINLKKDIALDILGGLVWRSFKLDFKTQISASEAAELIYTLVETVLK